MRLITTKAGVGRNKCVNIENGEVSIHCDGNLRDMTLTVKNGLIIKIQKIKYPTQYANDRIVMIKDWNKSEKIESRNVKTINRFEGYNRLPLEGTFFEVSGLVLGKHKGTLYQIAKQGRFVREEFIYQNGQIAYVWTPYRRTFKVFLPNGKLWMEVTTKILRPYKRSMALFGKVCLTLADLFRHEDSWSYKTDYEIKIYNRNGKLHCYGKVENRQRVGIWKNGQIQQYFMMGVPVSKNLFYADPDDMDPREVLKTENTQLRASLMKKIGPEKLLKKLPFITCDTSSENQLLKVDVKNIFDDKTMKQLRDRNNLDDQIAIAVLKCPSTEQLYYLRVPPRLKKVEHARQWLCGIDIEETEEEYIRDRWNRASAGGQNQLTSRQQEQMKDEIGQASQRQKLEFVTEA